MLRFGLIVLLAMLLAGCGAGPANRPSVATLPPPAATSAPAEYVTAFENGLSIVVPGYWSSCFADPTLSIKAADGWKPLKQIVMEPHYVENEHRWGVFWCDYPVCSKVSLENPIRIDFPLYEYLGKHHASKDEAGTTLATGPAYRTVRPSGTVKIDVTYFVDAACSQARNYATTLDLPN